MKKIIKRVLLTILALIIILTGVSKIYHTVNLNKESSLLNEYGVGKYVNVDGKKINVYSNKNNNADKTIVYLSGLGMSDTSISTRPLWNNLKDKYNIAVIDRAGLGMSDDTTKPRTVENIVEEYRSSLKESGIKDPYILTAHSISGIYATYWSQKYPNEIDSLIYIDADPAEYYAEGGKPSFSTLAVSKLENIFAATGLQRFIVSASTLIGNDISHVYTDEEKAMRSYLMYRNTYSNATHSEMKLYYDNTQTVLSNSVCSNIPKLYIIADNLNGKYYDNVYKETLSKKFKNDQIKIDDYKNTREERMQKKIDYMNGHGNVTIKKISGPHTLYEYAPEEVSTEILQFLENN